jgi:4a-hydroxytetrahydrobiopterin dehydratase
MTERTVLTGSALEAAIADLDGWVLESGKLHKEYVFEDFVSAFSFMTGAALCAEKRNHHPEWFNVYRTVRVDLWTHDVGGITDFDVELAREFDRVAGST